MYQARSYREYEQVTEVGSGEEATSDRNRVVVTKGRAALIAHLQKTAIISPSAHLSKRCGDAQGQRIDDLHPRSVRATTQRVGVRLAPG